MKIACALVTLLSLAVLLPTYSADSRSGLLFNDTTSEFVDTTDAQRYRDVKSALLVAPDDLPDRGHYSNSNMARVELLLIGPGGGVMPHRVSEDAREQVIIVLDGEIEFKAGEETMTAGLHDVVFVPPGLERSYVAVGGKAARILQADWKKKGAQLPVDAEARAFIVSEKLRPLERTGGEGYVTVAPSSRQHDIALSIVAYGAGHVNASNSLLLYPHDITEGRPFSANTRLVRMGLSQYHPGGGSRWHSHTDVEQCLVIVSGKGLLEIGANTVEVSAGDIVFAPRHLGHGYKTTGEHLLKFFELEWGRD